MDSIYDQLEARVRLPDTDRFDLYPITTPEELAEVLREHLGTSAKAKVYYESLHDRYLAEYRVLPMILDAEEKAIFSTIMKWAEKNGYDIRLMDVEKVRDICEKMQPCKPIGCCCGRCGYPLAAAFDYCPGCGTKINKEETK